MTPALHLVEVGAARTLTVPIADSPQIVVDTAAGSDFAVTLAGHRTLAAPLHSPATGSQAFTLWVSQDATGGRALAFDPVFAFSTMLAAPVLSPAPAALDVLAFRWHAGRWLLVGANQGFNL